jgi:ureidoacrylate peracid hydrolase
MAPPSSRDSQRGQHEGRPSRGQSSEPERRPGSTFVRPAARLIAEEIQTEEEPMPAAPVVFGREFFTVDPRSTALIVIDMQNGFVAKGATYETPGARTMMPNLERLLAFARERTMPVIWTQSDHSAPYSGIMLKKFPTIREDKYLWKDQPSFELYADMPQPKPGEFRVVKHKYDAFFETDLDAILRSQGIKSVIIVGTATNVCCESTARSAFFRDYGVAFPSDCNASFDDAMHQATLKTLDMFFARVMTTEELLQEMRGSNAPQAATEKSVA